MQITKGFKYRLYLNKEQQKQLDHCCFIYNQAYNICLDLQNKTWSENKDKNKEERIYPKSSKLDFKIKQALKNRNLPFKTVIAQRARINAERALREAIKKAFLNLKTLQSLINLLLGIIKDVLFKYEITKDLVYSVL